MAKKFISVRFDNFIRYENKVKKIKEELKNDNNRICGEKEKAKDGKSNNKINAR